MSAIEDVIGALDGVTEKLEEATASAQAAEQEADTGLDHANAAGANAAMEGFAAVKEQIETLKGLLDAARQGADEALSTAKAVADST
jgi:hypothetical protein